MTDLLTPYKLTELAKRVIRRLGLEETTDEIEWFLERLDQRYTELKRLMPINTKPETVLDSWVRYLELAVELDYQLWKGRGMPDQTLAKLNKVYAEIYADMTGVEQ